MYLYLYEHPGNKIANSSFHPWWTSLEKMRIGKSDKNMRDKYGLKGKYIEWCRLSWQNKEEWTKKVKKNGTIHARSKYSTDKKKDNGNAKKVGVKIWYFNKQGKNKHTIPVINSNAYNADSKSWKKQDIKEVIQSQRGEDKKTEWKQIIPQIHAMLKYPEYPIFFPRNETNLSQF